MRILITGGTGQLGRALRERLGGSDHDFRFTIRGEPKDELEVSMDLREPETIRRGVQKTEPDWIVHGAAITDVDYCEREPDAAHEVNETGTKLLAQAASDMGARVLYVSTDYVFDGKEGPYHEDADPCPINAYGRSKLAGERQVTDLLNRPLIARTCVVFGPHRANFVTWVIERLRAGERVPAIEDQSITPTYSLSLAEQLIALIEGDEEGIWHTAGADELTRLEMARIIAETLQLDTDLIEPTKRSELDWEAPRPRRAGLTTLRRDESVEAKPFRDAVYDLTQYPPR